jgi:hypothetical protein
MSHRGKAIDSRVLVKPGRPIVALRSRRPSVIVGVRVVVLARGIAHDLHPLHQRWVRSQQPGRSFHHPLQKRRARERWLLAVVACRNILCFQVFPMLVPSLSWQNSSFSIKCRNKDVSVPKIGPIHVVEDVRGSWADSRPARRRSLLGVLPMFVPSLSG